MDRRDHLDGPPRLDAFRRAALLDSRAQESFDRLARLAAVILDAPVALVSLVESGQVFQTFVGLREASASRQERRLSDSFCQHVVTSREELAVEDARRHSVLSDALATRDSDVVAYAGTPLVTSDGRALGSFCVVDTEPRRWTADELAILRDLAASVVAEAELRLRAAEAEQLLAETLAAAELRRTKALEINDDILQAAAAAKLALQLGEPATARSVLDETIDGARRVVAELLDDRGPVAVTPGMLRRNGVAYV